MQKTWRALLSISQEVCVHPFAGGLTYLYIYIYSTQGHTHITHVQDKQNLCGAEFKDPNLKFTCIILYPSLMEKSWSI